MVRGITPSSRMEHLHTSHLVQNWLSVNLQMFWSKEFWPPNSPDLNPLDYYMWGVLKRNSNKSRHPTTDFLKAAIDLAVLEMNCSHLVKACDRFHPRLEAAIEADGSWIEYIFWQLYQEEAHQVEAHEVEVQRVEAVEVPKVGAVEVNEVEAVEVNEIEAVKSYLHR